MLVRAPTSPLRTRPRVQRAPGIPCALPFSRANPGKTRAHRAARLRRYVLNEAQRVYRERTAGHLAGELGFEPRQTESESVVLPLHHSPRVLNNIRDLTGILRVLASDQAKSGAERPRRSTRSLPALASARRWAWCEGGGKAAAIPGRGWHPGQRESGA